MFDTSTAFQTPAREYVVWNQTGRCVATLEGHSNSVRCGVRYFWYLCDLPSLQVDAIAVFPDGRRVVSASWDNTLKVWDVETGKCLATLEGPSEVVRCGVHCSFVMMCLRCRSIVLPYLRTGAASCLRWTTRRSRSGTWRPANAWRRWKGTRNTTPCVAASTVLL